MRIISVRGFSDVQVAEMARELHCSVATLYKIAPSKDSLVALAIEGWGARTLEDLEVEARKAATASDRARAYFHAGAESIRAMTAEFYSDLALFESTRLAWVVGVADRYIERFVDLLQLAEDAGEIRRVNYRVLAEFLRQVGYVARDERVLRATGLSSAEVILELDSLLWDGLRATQTTSRGGTTASRSQKSPAGTTARPSPPGHRRDRSAGSNKRIGSTSKGE
jgi:AcrR family transcriptional regulator